MKKLCFLLLMSWVVMDVTAQNVVYSNLKGLLACEGDTVASLKVEKRTKNHILMTGGADYKISAGPDDSMCKYLKSRCYAVQADTSLYVNCKSAIRSFVSEVGMLPPYALETIFILVPFL